MGPLPLPGRDLDSSELYVEIYATWDRRSTVSSGSLTKSSPSAVMKLATPYEPGVCTGSMYSQFRKNRGAEVFRSAGIVV